ncbi:uncharacterized protein LOC143373684 [Andrena cerasifolii]|uniref:uncharacterized protein LOC143373684 n=1 Tax=Andrena cerasifolii TaxID=2819439 RepID=UPI004037EB96
MKMTQLSARIYKEFDFCSGDSSIDLRAFVFANGKADKTFNMFKLILLLAVAMVAVSAAPAPVPPVITHPLVYPQPYVKILPVHPAAVPLSYSHGYNGYNLVHPGSVYYY